MPVIARARSARKITAPEHADQHHPVGMVRAISRPRRSTISAARRAPSAASGTVTGLVGEEVVDGAGTKHRCACPAQLRPASTGSARARASPASGLRWRSTPWITWLYSVASRSAMLRYIRRWRASMPCFGNLAARIATASAASVEEDPLPLAGLQPARAGRTPLEPVIWRPSARTSQTSSACQRVRRPSARSHRSTARRRAPTSACPRWAPPAFRLGPRLRSPGRGRLQPPSFGRLDGR